MEKVRSDDVVRNRLLHRLGKNDKLNNSYSTLHLVTGAGEGDMMQANHSSTTKFDKYQRNNYPGSGCWGFFHFLNLKCLSMANDKKQMLVYCCYLLVLCGLGGMILTVGRFLHGSGIHHDPISWIVCLVPSPTVFLSPRCGFRPDWHPVLRKDRFPSVDERVQLYMSTWYLPPCSSSKERLRYRYILQDDNLRSPPFVQIMQYDNDSTAAAINITLETRMKPDTIFALNENGLSEENVGRYPQDAQKILHLYHELFPGSATTELPPIVITVGDSGGEHFAHHPIPYFCKWRPIARPSDWKWIQSTGMMSSCIESVENRGRFGQDMYSSNQTMYAPIVWGVSYRRHFRYVAWVPWYDTGWEKKQHGAIWRGVLTGAKGRVVMGDSFVSNCQRVPRCKFVEKFHKSETLNVGVSFQLDELLISEMYAKSMVKGTVSLRNMMKYKAIIIMEGNDVASGLKWALYSRSVVMMPEPTKTSFAMEELLVPWVHYIPLMEDGLDADEKLKWVLENDEEARKIAQRATLFMHDLLFHEDSVRENMQVEMEILRRYYALYNQL
jgi:Arabidopsis thaliana protein of unknown function (DUF821).